MVAMFMMNRWLPEHHHHAPLSSPVSRHSHRQLNFYIGIVLVVFMAVSVVALICCCYHLEWRLRLQARNAARRVNRGNVILGSHEMVSRVGKKSKQETNLSVMMPGDSIPSFLAKAKPHGSSSGVEFSDFHVSEAKNTSQTLR
ncbi:hypothetical protein M758_11G151200 [Ceratodon purpureus]|uniref:Uncharacterized protein n=1 Tax=Ceratodon purpureus TaxID=3225 RepID=A0A8T0GEC3_CERPU|nr:hypothetical protein KC19_11G154800 [Ceratodon purpureus]KAG0601963.1 hypothetical protein M758_11G151200 [Ceratodon purpureus]